MYAVIFRAQVKELDAQYGELAARLRDRAIEEFGCLEFTACTEGDSEIAISYWPDLEHIRAWREDAIHREAQALGRERWYRSYQVQVVEVLRDYGGNN